MLIGFPATAYTTVCRYASAPLPEQPRALPRQPRRKRFPAPSGRYLKIQRRREFSLNLFLPGERMMGFGSYHDLDTEPARCTDPIVGPVSLRRDDQRHDRSLSHVSLFIQAFRSAFFVARIMAMSQALMSFSDEALERIIEIRDQEPGDDEYGLLIEITGIQGTQFGYSLSFVPLDEAAAGDHIEGHGNLKVIIPSVDTGNMSGARLAMSTNPMTPGLAIDNPNNPSPTIPDVPEGNLTGPLAERVAQVLDNQVNPAIAAHGGVARLVSAENGVVYLQLGGGCQGCGMAAMTLRQGIERILRDNIPEIVEIVDVTDHQGGENPYYAASKKG